MVCPFGGDGGACSSSRTTRCATSRSTRATCGSPRTRAERREHGRVAEITPACGAFTYTPDPCDPQPRFIAPFGPPEGAQRALGPGGHFVWDTADGWRTHCTDTACDWKIAHDTGEASQITAISVNGATSTRGTAATDATPRTSSMPGSTRTTAGPGHGGRPGSSTAANSCRSAYVNTGGQSGG